MAEVVVKASQVKEGESRTLKMMSRSLQDSSDADTKTVATLFKNLGSARNGTPRRR